MPTLQVSRDKVIFKEEYNTRTMLFLGFAVVMVAQLLFFHPELLPFKDARLFPPLVGTLPVLILPFVLLNCIQSVWDADTNTVTIEQVWLYGLMKSRETIPVKDIEKCVAVKRLGRYRSAMGYTIRLQFEIRTYDPIAEYLYLDSSGGV